MDSWVWIVIVVAAIMLLAAVWAGMRNRRSGQLKEGFGPEYDRTVDEAGSRRKAESELAERQKRHEELDVRPLSPAARDRYLDQWRDTQARFVDDPGSAVGDADRLVQEVMRERGYPTDDFEQRAADISVEHPQLVENYRSAHATAEAHTRGDATTEELRQSLVHYRVVFEDLLETGSPERMEAQR